MARRRDKISPAEKAEQARAKAARKKVSKERNKSRRLAREEGAQVALAESRKRQKNPTADFLGPGRGLRYGEIENPKFERLVGFLSKKSPKLLIHQNRTALEMLSKLTWHRALQTWKPKGKGRDSLFRSLVNHLVDVYPMPRFLLSLFYIEGSGHGFDTIKMYQHFASGGSVKAALKQKLLSTPLTKKMAHTFMSSPSSYGFIEAVRRAQVEHLGGDRRLADALLETQIGRGISAGGGGDEEFWLTVVQWFAQIPMLDMAQVGPIIDWIRHHYVLRSQERARAERLRRAGDDAPDPGAFTMKGRTPFSVLRAVEEWHTELTRVRKAKGEYRPSGFKEDIWEVKKGDRAEVWSCTEILNGDLLAAEGRAMRHCVYSYSYSIKSGRTSIWSLKRTDELGAQTERQLTIEVNNSNRMIVQARGKSNRWSTNVQRREMGRWASFAGLRVGSYA